jgi:hypothetical protein
MTQVLERHSGLWIGLRAAVNSARDAALAQKNDEVKAAGNDLEESLRSEMAYLRAQKRSRKKNDAVAALREREALLASVRSPSVVTDAVAIVIGGR